MQLCHREKIQALRQRLRNPPSPDAPELIGAVMMQPALLESLEYRLRDDGTGKFTAGFLLEPLELGVLATCLHLLRELGSVEISGMATTARWPRREPPIVPVEGLRDALLQLRHQRWLAFTVEGDVARVGYGDRIHQLAANWGVDLRTPSG